MGQQSKDLVVGGLKNWHKRWDIETDFRFLKSQLYYECCQSTSKKVQENHYIAGWGSFMAIQMLSKELNLNWYKTTLKANLHKKELQEICVSLINSGL